MLPPAGFPRKSPELDNPGAPFSCARALTSYRLFRCKLCPIRVFNLIYINFYLLSTGWKVRIPTRISRNLRMFVILSKKEELQST